MAEYERLAQQVVDHANQLRAAGHKVKYSDFAPEVNARLRAYNATMRINQMELMKSKISTHLLDLGMNIETKVGDKLYNDYLKEMKRQAGILGTTSSNELWVSQSVLSHITSSINVASFSKNIWANIDVMKANLDGLLATAVVRGDNPRELVRYLTKYVKSEVGDKRYAAERIARTETARVQHEVQLESLKGNDYKYCKWYAEPGACKTCREISESSGGKNLPESVYPVDDVPDIPVHPNCRCSIGAYWLDKDNKDEE